MITSLAFWVALVPAALLAWRFPRHRDAIVAVASVGFVAWEDWRSVVIVLVLAGAAYAIAQRPGGAPKWQTRALVLAALAALAAYKYAPSLASAFAAPPRQARNPGAPPLVPLGIPLGISYFTFKLIHYVVDASRKQIPAHRPQQFLGYMLNLAMFGAGPIQRFDEYVRDAAPRVTRQQFVDGGTRLAYGLVKKLVFVNLFLDRRAPHDTSRLFEAVPFVYAPCPVDQLLRESGKIHPLWVWQFVIHQFTQWYLDFSAYTDIAIGAALLLGFKLTENFDWPLVARNPTEFWKRYHMSLSAFCQRYVYLPMMGRTRNPYVAVYATMIAMGLWHEGNLNYLCWGVYHATVLSLYLTWGRIKRAKKWKLKGNAILVAGTIATALAASVSAIFPATAQQGIGAAGRLLLVLVGIHR